MYVGADDRHFYALDGKDGSKKWSFEADGLFDSSPALAADGTVYVGCGNGCLYAIK